MAGTTQKRPVDTRQIRFKPENADWLREEATVQDRSVNWLVNYAITQMRKAKAEDEIRQATDLLG